MPYLSIYITYCCNFTAANKFLAELKQGKYDLAGFLKEQQIKACCDIQDLLILPVQSMLFCEINYHYLWNKLFVLITLGIPRYRLLLTSLLEHTHELHMDHAILKESLKKTEEVAERYYQ